MVYKYDYIPVEAREPKPASGGFPTHPDPDMQRRSSIDAWWNKFGISPLDCSTLKLIKEYLPQGDIWSRLSMTASAGRGEPEHIAYYLEKSNIAFTGSGRLYAQQTILNESAQAHVHTWSAAWGRDDWPAWEILPLWLKQVAEMYSPITATYVGTFKRTNLWERHRMDQCRMVDLLLRWKKCNLHIMVDTAAIYEYIKGFIRALIELGPDEFLCHNPDIRRRMTEQGYSVNRTEELDEDAGVCTGYMVNPFPDDRRARRISDAQVKRDPVRFRRTRTIALFIISQYSAIMVMKGGSSSLQVLKDSKGPFLIVRSPICGIDVPPEISKIIEAALIAEFGDSVTNSKWGDDDYEEPLEQFGVGEYERIDRLIQHGTIHASALEPHLLHQFGAAKTWNLLVASIFTRPGEEVPVHIGSINPGAVGYTLNIDPSVIAIETHGAAAAEDFRCHDRSHYNPSYHEPDITERNSKVIPVLNTPCVRQYMMSIRHDRPAIVNRLLKALAIEHVTIISASKRFHSTVRTDPVKAKDPQALGKVIEHQLDALYRAFPEYQECLMALGSKFWMKPSRLRAVEESMMKYGDNVHDTVHRLMEKTNSKVFVLSLNPLQIIDDSKASRHSVIYVLPPNTMARQDIPNTPYPVKLKLLESSIKIAFIRLDSRLHIHAIDQPSKNVVSDSPETRLFEAVSQIRLLEPISLSSPAFQGVLHRFNPTFIASRHGGGLAYDTGIRNIPSSPDFNEYLKHFDSTASSAARHDPDVTAPENNQPRKRQKVNGPLGSSYVGFQPLRPVDTMSTLSLLKCGIGEGKDETGRCNLINIHAGGSSKGSLRVSDRRKISRNAKKHTKGTN